MFFGENGSGKTSLLECAHILGTSRSFRGGSPKSQISHGMEAYVVQGERLTEQSNTRSIGVQRGRAGDVQLRVAGESVGSAAMLADELPLLVLNAESFDLLLGEPANRRRFMDWGVFHVEHEARPYRRRFQRALNQRNHLLRRGKIDPSEVAPWSRELAECGERIAAARERFVASISVAFAPLMRTLAPDLEDIQLHYRRGWSEQQSYAEALEEGFQSDCSQGFTQRGPQRAEVRFTQAGYPAAETLSRGQQKLLVCALKLAQGRILMDSGRRQLLYLVDDLPAELDRERCERVCRQLSALNAQTMITAIHAADVPREWLSSAACETEVAMFHVKHGGIERQNSDGKT